MSPADRYRALAAQLRARAARELSPVMRAQRANLSQCYVRLAEQADHNSRTDIVYESGRSNRSGDLGGKPA